MFAPYIHIQCHMENNYQKASRLFLAQYNFVLGLAIHYAPNAFLADDIVHQVFIEFVEHAERWNLNADIRPILVRLTRFAASAHWREYRKMMPESLRKVAEHLQIAMEQRTASVRNNDILALRTCLSELSPKSINLGRAHTTVVKFHGSWRT